LDFLKSKFDNLCLVGLLVFMILILLHMSHDKADADLVAWLEQALTTVLGAYIGLTQAGRVAWNKPQGGTNGTKTNGVVAVTTPAVNP
jgi:Tfp pilus assembly protein PilZ